MMRSNRVSSGIVLGVLFVGSFGVVPQLAHAAISFVGSAESSSSPNADTTIDLTTIADLSESDLVIVAASSGDDESADLNLVNNTSGYTKIADLFSNDTDDTNLAVWWKFMEASPDANIVIEGSGIGGTDSSLAAVVMVFRGVDTTTPFDVASTTATGLNAPNPDPPSIDHNNPAGVWTVIAGGNSHIAAGSCTFTFPTGHTTDSIDRGHNDTNDTTVGMGYRESGVSDPEDPGAMTHSCANNVSNSWAAVTMALRPSTVTIPIVTTDYVSNVGATSATLFGSISDNGGSDATQHGFAFSTSPTLSSGVSTSTLGGYSGTGSFSSAATSLSEDVTYYFRAYSRNTAGTGYGNIVSFMTGNTSLTRSMRLFEGFAVKFYSGKIRFYGS